MSGAPWVQLKSGLPFDLLTPTVEQARAAVPDLIASICALPRYNAHTLGDHGWTVGQHSLLVAELLTRWGAPPAVVREGLLHDLPEGVYGDISSPVQRAIRALCGEHQTAINPLTLLRRGVDCVVREAVGLPESEHPHVKRADLVALAIERRDLMAKCERDWCLPEYAPTEVYASPEKYGLGVAAVRKGFLARLVDLDRACGIAAPEAA